MDNNTIIGYNILAKRAIETESGVNIDDALNRITAYNIVGYTEDGTPAVPNGISTKILYLATNRPGMPDAKYTGWIFTTLSGWVKVFDELTGDDVNSWKSWSEEHGSSSTKDGSVYIGPDNSIRRADTYVLGKNNTVKNESDSDVYYEGTDVVMLGTDNSSVDGANVYQLGRENRVIGNNLGSRESYPKQVAVNIGIDNTITSYSNTSEYAGEGVNIGKSNSSSMFGIAIGQNNKSSGASVVIGENLNASDTYSATIIGHEKAEYQVESIENGPSLNGIPLGKYELLDFRNYGREVKHAWFDSNGHLVETKRYYAVVNADTDEVKFEDNDNTNGYYISSNGNRYGYIDDTGLLISTNDPAPAGKVKNTYTAYYTTRHSYSERVYFWGTSYNTKYIRTDQFVPDIWRTYKLSEVSQYFIDSDLGNVYISDTEAFSKTYNRDEFVLYKVRVTGKEVNGTFIPWFNDNFDLNECTTRDFYPSELNYQSSIYLNTNKIVLNEENCGSKFTDVSYGATLFGTLAKVEYGGSAYTQTHNHYIALKYPSLPGYQSFNSTRYTWNGSSYSSQSYSFCSIDNEVQLTPSGILKIIQPYVHNGSVGIAALTGEYNTAIDDYSNFSNSLEVSYGSLGIGDRMYIDTGSIGIGRNQFGIGSGTIAIGMDNLWGTNKYNNNYGATLIGKYNKSSISGDPLSGSTVVGNNNYFDNYAFGAVLLGNYNRFDSYDGGYGSVLIGVNSSIKGSGSIAIGTGYNGSGGAHARYGAVAISYKGAIASNGATALGGNGCAAFSGATSIGWNGCMSYTGGIALGWNGVTAQYGSVAIGHDGSCTLMGGVSIGWNGVCSEYGSVTLGFEGAFANGGSFAIGHNGVNGLYGGIAIGLNNSFAEAGAISIGTNTVKGKSGSIALGLCGTYAVGGSVAIGHKSHAFYGGLSVVNNTTGGPDYSFQENSNLPFVYYRESEESYCYPEFRVLKGTPTKVDYIYGSDNTVVDVIENPNGRYSAYKTATGKYYENLSSIPYTEWSRVWIRATEDEDGTIHPFYGMKINMLEAQERVDNWVEVPICRSGALQPGECSIQNHPGLDELEMDCAANGGNTFGAKAFSKYGSVSIGTDYAAGGFSCSNRAITIDGYEAREFDRYSGCINNGKFYPWNVYQAYSAYNSVAIGSSVIAENASIAMGIAPVKANYGSLALGYGAGADYDDLIYGIADDGSLLICGRDNTDGIVKRGISTSKSIGIGTGVVATSDSIAIGDRTEADEISSAIGFCSTADNASIAYGDSNHSKLNAISIGSRNISSGWSIALGVNNTSYDGLGGHATMIGQFNTSTSNQEVIHKEFQMYVDGEPTQEQINELTGRESAYRRLLDPYLDSEMIAYLNTTDAGNNDYYLGRADEMAWGYYSYFSWLQTLGNQPPIIFSSSIS